MSWSSKPEYSWLQKFCLNVIKAGPIPKHVAFIMDGNRRFAKKNNISINEAHNQGFNTMSAAIHWCTDIGIQEVTFYALSIENFKRSKDEVDTLLKLAKEKFNKLLFDEMNNMMAHGVCIRIFGDFSVLDDELKNLIARIILATKDNKTFFVNIAFAYTSRQEIKTAISNIMKAVETNIINENDITKHLISKCLYTNNCLDIELLIRSSGEVRFSDFMLWQSINSHILFTDNLWPELGMWRILALVFHYQRHYKRTQERIKQSQEIICTESKSLQVQEFLNKLNHKRVKILESYL